MLSVAAGENNCVSPGLGGVLRTDAANAVANKDRQTENGSFGSYQPVSLETGCYGDNILGRVVIRNS